MRKFKEISKAVQLVAIAKLRKLQSVIESREYALSVAQGLFDDMNDDDDISDCTHCIVVITSERSCCGKLNNEVLLAAKDAISLLVDDNKRTSIVSIGWKGKDSLAVQHKSELSHSLSYLGKSCFFLSYVVLLSILDTGYDRCTIFFSKYYKIFEQVAAVYEYKSYNIFVDSVYKRRKQNILFDVIVSSVSVDLRNLYFYNACIVLLDAFEETKYSELGCRAFSMEMAHRNATELIHEKMLIYNKARQAGITTDLLEVVAGAIYTV